MIDTSTQQPLRVREKGLFGPCIRVPIDQLPNVESLLNRHGYGYKVDQNAISLDHGPYFAFINLAGKISIGELQRILDAAD